jgi:hypothetical protein
VRGSGLCEAGQLCSEEVRSLFCVSRYVQSITPSRVPQQPRQLGNIRDDPLRLVPTLREKVTGILVFVGAAVAALGTLYLLGLWVDH